MAETAGLPKEEQEALEAKEKRDQVARQDDDESVGDDESEDEPPEHHPYMKMFEPTIARPFLGKSWVIFMMFFLLYYILQLGLALMCCNFYSQSHPVRLQSFNYEVI